MLQNQQWSKVKKRLDSFTCESLKERVQFTVTNYRRAHDQLGRAFITVDKKEVLNMCTITSEAALNKRTYEIKRKKQIPYTDWSQESVVWNEAHEWVLDEGVFAQYDFFDAVEEYFQNSIEESLESNNMLIKIFALIDRRAGKRTLEKMKQSILCEKEIVQFFYQLRCKAEGIRIHG
ncbi:hypothetical protein DFO70_11060 [Cytobacillus firmus]|uniref:Uncharacterized protein n=2 Tax=Cytobacillus TaxID=2675230 RepID=A0A366JSP0_CYTFI|nr:MULTISPECIES: hypothetical protein [Cytobacillus]RBP89955.1 hypothetical protein DFO70_11060 [Cytobacillus firmus]TDX40403.1 hypothetical protein DFO72_10971 [Cytobacillus oceanisediminis]